MAHKLGVGLPPAPRGGQRDPDPLRDPLQRCGPAHQAGRLPAVRVSLRPRPGTLRVAAYLGLQGNTDDQRLESLIAALDDLRVAAWTFPRPSRITV
jgi:hypothetical protein